MKLIFEWWHLIYLLPLIPIALAIWFLCWCNREDRRWNESNDLVQNAERPFVESDYNTEISSLLKKPAFKLALIAIVGVFACAVMWVINLLTRK